MKAKKTRRKQRRRSRRRRRRSKAEGAPLASSLVRCVCGCDRGDRAPVEQHRSPRGVDHQSRRAGSQGDGHRGRCQGRSCAEAFAVLNGICAKGCTIRLTTTKTTSTSSRQTTSSRSRTVASTTRGPILRLSRRRLRRPVPGPPGRGKRPKSLAPAAWFKIGWQGVLYFVSIHWLN